MLLIEDNAKHCGDQLTDDGSIGSAPDTHSRAAEEAEDHNGIEDDIDDGADALNEHGDEVWPVPCSIRSVVISTKMPMEPMQTMERYWAPYSAMMGKHLLHGEVELRAENPEQREYYGGADGKQQANISDFLGGLAVFSPRRRESRAFIPTPVPVAKAIMRF